MAADIVLTGHSVNSSKRSKYSDRSDRRETNILQVERVFQHPVNTHKQKRVSAFNKAKYLNICIHYKAHYPPFTVLLLINPHFGFIGIFKIT